MKNLEMEREKKNINVCVCVRASCLHSNNMKKCLKQGVGHTMALPFTLESILRQKKNYENSNIFTMQNFSLQKKL